MPWTGLSNFLMGRQGPQHENPYVMYVRKRCLENHERYRRGIPNLPLLECEEWVQNYEQAIIDWQDRIMQRHNQDHKTNYRNWNDLSRAKMDSAMRDKFARATTKGRIQNERDELLSFSPGPQEPTNLFGETDQEYLASTMRSHGRSGINHAPGRSFHSRSFEDGGRATGDSYNIRGSSPGSKQGVAGWSGQSERLNGGVHILLRRAIRAGRKTAARMKPRLS